VSLVTPDVCLAQSLARLKCVVPQLPMHRLSARSWIAARRKSWEESVIVNSRVENSNIWTVYSLDRALATIMGRPIGLRDEACELRVSLLSNLLHFGKN
jgi:hypothetical protein